MTNEPPPSRTHPAPQIWHRALAAWPMFLIAIGGAAGGLCGGAAWAINDKIMQSDRPIALRYLLVLLVGFGAIAAWLALVFVLSLLFPNLFAPR